MERIYYAVVLEDGDTDREVIEDLARRIQGKIEETVCVAKFSDNGESIKLEDIYEV